jgi:hypothetical protein
MIIVKDKSFNLWQFKSLIEYLDPLVIAEKLCGNDVVYEVKNGGQNYMGYIHVIHFTINGENGFNLYIYENQSLKSKGFIAFKIKNNTINAMVEKRKLMASGYGKVDIKKGPDYWTIAVSLKDLDEQFRKIIENYRVHIF